MNLRYCLAPFAAALLLHLPGHSQPAGNARPLPDGVYRFQRAEVPDTHGFGRKMTALTLFVPAGWSTSGGVVWGQSNASCGTNATHFAWRAVSPDGSQAVEILPEESWSGNNLPLPPMGTCPNISITNARDFLHWYVQRNRKGARVLDYRPRPEFAETLKHFNRTDASMGGELKSWVEGGEILIGYNQQGRDMRESIAMSVLFTLNRMQGVYPGEIREFRTVSTLPAFSARAPHGQLDFKRSEAIRRSIKTDPEWSTAMHEHTMKMSRISAKGAADRHEIRMKTAQEIAEINRQGYQNQQASQDRSVEKFNQTMRGVDTYVDSTSNERVELPATHDNVWRLNDGTFILTNDASFQPGRDFGLEGQRLEVAK